MTIVLMVVAYFATSALIDTSSAEAQEHTTHAQYMSAAVAGLYCAPLGSVAAV